MGSRHHLISHQPLLATLLACLEKPSGLLKILIILEDFNNSLEAMKATSSSTIAMTGRARGRTWFWMDQCLQLCWFMASLDLENGKFGVREKCSIKSKLFFILCVLN